MKKISIVKTTFALFCAAFLFLANSTNPPNGRTGAPYPGNTSGNEPVCGNCHGGNNPLGLEGDLDIVGVPATIQPNTTYPLSVTITKTAGDIYRAGFQMLILDENADDAGTASNFDSETVQTMSGGRKYIEHGSGAIQFGSENSVSYTFDWTSPNSITGNNITFYMVTVLGNGSGTAQDNSFTNYPTFPFASNSNPLSIININTTDPLCNNETNGSATVMTSGGNGSNTYAWSSGGNMQTENNLAPGNYMVTVSSGGESISQPFTINNPPAITTTISNQTSIDCNNPTASATVVATGGTGMLSYLWDNNDQTETATELSAGNHNVTIFDSNNCQVVQTVNIASDTVTPTAEAGPAASLDCANNTVQLNGAGSDTGGNISYQWQTGNGTIMSGANTLTPTVSAAGTYTLTVTNNTNGCTSSDFVFVNSNATLPLAEAGQSASLNCNNSTVQLNGAGSSQGDVSYFWTSSNGGTITSGANTLTPTVSTAGLYTLTVTDNSNNCESTDNVQVSADFTEPIVSIAAPNQIGCDNSILDLDGSASSTGGQFSYQWTSANGSGIVSGANTNVATVNITGTYTLTVTNNSNGCANASSVVVTGDTTIPVADAGLSMTLNCSVNQVTLNGNGSSSGANFTYQWTGGNIVSGATTLTPTVNTAGIYTLTVINNQNSCESSSSVNVDLDTDVPVTIIQNPDLIDCNQNAIVLDGSSSGQGANIEYQWSTNNGNIVSGENTLMATVDSPGEYCLTTTNVQNGCSSESCATVTEATAPITAISSQGMITCNGDMNGFVSVESTGGSGTYSYFWSTEATGPTIQGLGAGIYTVTTTDGNQCASVLSVTITEPTALSLSVSSTSETGSGANDGTAMANGGGGTGVLSYEWSNSETTQQISNLAPGTYSVTVTDENNCITTGEVSISSFDCALAIEGIATIDVSCNGEATGEATVAASSSSTLSYAWSSGGNMATETGLIAGTYTVTVTDAANCEAIQSVTISEPELLLATSSTSSVSCNGGNDGSASIVATGGTAPYVYNWPNGGNGNNLAAGFYTVTVIDDAQCATTTDFTITEPTAIALQMSSTVASSDVATDGTAIAGVQGGTPNYTFLWDDADAQTAEVATNLAVGDYCVTVTDANGCEETSCVSVTVSGCASLVGGTGSTPVSCNGFSDGTAFIDVTGGSEMYSYAWSSGDTEATATDLTAGLYFVTVTDTDDCSLIEEVLVEQPFALTVQVVEQNNIECEGQTSGSATVEASGGTAGYTYAWSNGGEGATQMNLAADTYEVTATDANACQTVFSFSIIASEDTTLPTVITQNPIFEASDITINAETLDGGSFDNCGIGALSLSQTTFTCDNIGENEVTLFVTDVNGNTNSATAIVTLIDTTAPVVECPTVYTVDCDGTVTYDFEATDICGISAINIDAGMQSGDVFSPGTTTVTIEAIDNVGNLATCSFDVTVESIFTVLATGIDVSCNGGNDGDVIIDAEGGAAPYISTIENGELGALSAGTYTVLVTDANGCVGSAEIEIGEPDAISVEFSQVIDEQNQTANGAIVIDVSGGAEDYSFSWTGPNNFTSTEEDLLNLSAGDYVLVVTDANGCELTTEVVTVDNLTSIEEPTWAKSLGLFPNPVSDILTVELPTFTTSDLTIELLNARGQTMQLIDKERNSNGVRMNVSTLPSGLYWVKVQMEGELVVRKVVVD